MKGLHSEESSEGGKMTRDLTEGSPLKKILIFAFPLYFGMLFQQFYNMVDTVIVGRFLGVKALAGVGSTASLNFMVLGFCNGLCSGFSIPISQSFGAKNYSAMRKYTANCFWLCGFFSLIITIVVCIFCRPILIQLHTPENVFHYAYLYIFVIFLGIPFTVLYNILAGIFRALGDSKSPLLFLVMSSVLNIVLDLITICLLKMDVEGPALATVFSQAFSGIICFIYMKKKFRILKMNAEEKALSHFHVRVLCHTGIPMGLQYSVTAIGSLIIQSAVNSLGSSVVAGVTASQKIHSFIACPLEALGATMAPYTGQNMGAGKIDRIGKGTLDACLCGFVASGIILALILLFGRNLISLFLDKPNDEIVRYAWQFMITTSYSYCFLTLVNVVRFSIQGMGFSFVAIISGLMEMIARSFVGLVLAPKFGFSALCFAHTLAWIMADSFLIPTFLICKKRVRIQLCHGPLVH